MRLTKQEQELVLESLRINLSLLEQEDQEREQNGLSQANQGNIITLTELIKKFQ